MRNRVGLGLALAVGLVGLSSHAAWARKRPESKLFLREGELLPPTILRVLVIPFTTGKEKAAHHGHTIARVIREEFEAREFEVVDPEDVETALKAAPLPTERPLSDEDAIALAKQFEADWVAFGHIESIGVKSTRLLGIPLPGRKYASTSLYTTVLETSTGEPVFRHDREISEAVGNTWLTASEVARVRILRECADHLYDPLFERLPPPAANVYKGTVYVADGLALDPFRHKVAVIPFVDSRGFLEYGMLAAELVRGHFQERGFYVYRLDEPHFQYVTRGLDRDEHDDDATVAEVGRAIGADYAIHGRVLYLDVEPRSLPGAKYAKLPLPVSIPLPGRIRATCIMKAKMVDTRSGQSVYRSHRRADDSAVGAQWFTREHDARKKILRRCIRYCFENLMDTLPEPVASK
jgi:hypothetical protein